MASICLYSSLRLSFTRTSTFHYYQDFSVKYQVYTSFLSIGILHNAPFNFEACPFGIMVTFLKIIRLEIRTPLFNRRISLKSLGTVIQI